MALTKSNMPGLGMKAPSFNLKDTISERRIGYDQVKGKLGTLVMFICNHCPYVIHVNPEIVRLVEDYGNLIGFVGISSNDVVKYPQDGPEKMKIHALETGYLFPYLYDETQDVARAYHAACTPDFYLFDSLDMLVYRGRIDESRPGNSKDLNGKDMRDAIEALIKGDKLHPIQYPSMGCNIKWK